MSLIGRSRGRWLKAVFVLAVTVGAAWFVPFPASAAPKLTVEQARQKVEDLNHEAEVATERYNDTREQISSLNVRLAAAQQKLAEQKKAVAKAREALGQVAADTYKAGDLATLSLFLSDDPDKYVTANGLLVSLGDRKAQAMESVLRQQQVLVATMTDVQEQQQRLEKARKDQQDAKAEVERKLSEATSVLARLTAEERGRLGTLRAGRDRTSLEDLGFKVPSSGRLTCKDVPIVPGSARVKKVLDYACAQIGDPYRWAGDGPTDFDCSGLTMMAWKAAGVSLPHSSQLQATYGTKVALDDLQPGDLVFFRASLSHVGIFIGNGLMLHAPQTGDHVKIAPMRYNSSFNTAVRL